jgi:OmpA-OmpF porin, OOP family
MPDSFFTSLSNVLPSTAIQGIASHFGASEKTVLDGVQSSVAAIANGIAQKSQRQGLLRPCCSAGIFNSRKRSFIRSFV